MHNHGEVNGLAKSITTRANGVFLWAALVMETVCRHIVLGCPVSVLQSYVNKLPSELSEYFQRMIFKRIHESLLSETAMALSIALLPQNDTRYMRRFALICLHEYRSVVAHRSWICLELASHFSHSRWCRWTHKQDYDIPLRLLQRHALGLSAPV